jgi:hypothetical protein
MSQKVLLVEGDDDQHVVWSLCKARELPECFAVEVKRGKDALLRGLPGYLKDPLAYPVVGILLDADERIESTWDAVAGRLRGAGYPLPSSPHTAGMVLDHPDSDGPRVGVWLMPDNRLPGMLEDFVRLLIPAGDALAPEAERALQVIEGQRLQRYASQHRPKAFVHTWLAWQEEPGKPMGLAITKRYLDPTSPQADVFVAWLCRLFT